MRKQPKLDKMLIGDAYCLEVFYITLATKHAENPEDATYKPMRFSADEDNPKLILAHEIYEAVARDESLYDSAIDCGEVKLVYPELSYAAAAFDYLSDVKRFLENEIREYDESLLGIEIDQIPDDPKARLEIIQGQMLRVREAIRACKIVAAKTSTKDMPSTYAVVLPELIQAITDFEKAHRG